MGRIRLLVLLVLLVLGAGALPLAAQTQDPPACAGTRTAVEIAQLTVEETALAASGTWKVEGTQAGAMLEMRLDSDRMASETRSGATGPWSFAFDYTGAFKKCGRHTLRVYAFPVVKEGNRLVHCLGRGESVAKPFTISCSPKARIDFCSWDCPVDDLSGCAGICNASASGGAPGLVGFQAINNTGYKVIDGPEGGPWTWSFTCKRGERMSFKVRDQQGIGAVSNVAEILCGATEVLPPQEPPPTR